MGSRPKKKAWNQRWRHMKMMEGSATPSNFIHFIPTVTSGMWTGWCEKPRDELRSEKWATRAAVWTEPLITVSYRAVSSSCGKHGTQRESDANSCGFLKWHRMHSVLSYTVEKYTKESVCSSKTQRHKHWPPRRTQKEETSERVLHNVVCM